jgi:arylsulfatase A-like enzyme
MKGNEMEQRLFVTALYLLTAISVFGQQKNPNIIFIMSDDHTSQAIGAYRSHLAKLNPTPAAWEFYDLKTDPNEMHNQYSNPEYAKDITNMKLELKRIRKELGETDADYPKIQEVIDAHWND